jgi:hypothetical protein
MLEPRDHRQVVAAAGAFGFDVRCPKDSRLELPSQPEHITKIPGWVAARACERKSFQTRTCRPASAALNDLPAWSGRCADASQQRAFATDRTHSRAERAWSFHSRARVYDQFRHTQRIPRPTSSRLRRSAKRQFPAASVQMKLCGSRRKSGELSTSTSRIDDSTSAASGCIRIVAGVAFWNQHIIGCVDASAFSTQRQAIFRTDIAG